MNEKRKNYWIGKTVVITSTPYTKELETFKLSKNVTVKSSKSSKDVLAKYNNSRMFLLKIVNC